MSRGGRCLGANVRRDTILSLLYDGRVVVESLRHELQCQLVAHAARLLHLGALVLEPDLDLRLVELELGGERLAPLLGQVLAGVELALEPVQLGGRERRPRSLLVGWRAAAAAAAVTAAARRSVLLLRLTSPRTCTVHSHRPELKVCPQQKVKVKVNGVWQLATRLAATRTHVPYGITQCYLPLGRGDIPAITPAEAAGTRFSDPGRMQG